MFATDTIAAQATAPGQGGVGIIRISGPQAKTAAQAVLTKVPAPRYADYLPFYDSSSTVIDQGIALFFPGPNSFTGEDVLELQGHGGPVVLDMLLRTVTAIDGIRMAKPGEFSERAFLNDKLDLTQAEAIADLIACSSEQAARSALNSLQGAFSRAIDQLVTKVIALRMYVEAAIDFPEEEIDFLSDGKVTNDLEEIITTLEQVEDKAKQGSIMREGMKVVIAGRPNAGKSSLLNALVEKDSAIVTDIAGTTRDVLREHIHIDGMPLHIIDTAGLRDSPDTVEQIGIQRAWEEIKQADKVLLMVDCHSIDSIDPEVIWPEFISQLEPGTSLTIIRNKIDINGEAPGKVADSPYPVINISASIGAGVPELKQHLKSYMGYQGTAEGAFMARRRHLDALSAAKQHILTGRDQLEQFWAGELLAEELRLSQQYLNEITGEFSNDDLLGKIFSSFCIGK